ncbi:16S rRNA (guanine(527)-N(7))-methyltransferase RsmG [Alkalihalobacillus hemicellulosilyticus]|uniref:Ribosomal RNA small subunit methyltransferase G n=1 Tax=Halalkalibacter hemicellulosilyticusJCM 9152 TaxID=1236971 RepID=W4QLR6_9BACI|nr:16S rRNA (guanine(527)-N(7))-methyltransferase RsmG [Halalkalibacter hemicellulosilyticus]GAE32294.1 rRNA small subunit methyltransferase [Halalkalibacter hemicellulosilyticusJCM 9152]
MFKETFSSQLTEQGISISAHQLHQFNLYYKLLVEWNEKMNLTAITEENDVYLKHFYDSVSAAFYYSFEDELHLIDVGAGAGFPSIPLKILFPQLNVSIVDSLKKRIGFLEHLVSTLGLQQVSLHHDRAETFGQNKRFRESFDIVTARAVARLSVLSELCLPLIKEGGDFLAMKASGGTIELSDAKKGIAILGGEIKGDYSFNLPIEESERHIIHITKVKKTPKKYPRKPGTPNKTPL